jgi:hypothetical protein
MSDALKAAGFKPYLANRYDLAQSIGIGFKTVYITDKKTYRAELVGLDVILVAKLEESKP